MTEPPTQRLAALDVGSNSIHLVVVEADAYGNQRVLAREKAMVRLAKGLARTGRLAPQALREGLKALERMAALACSLECDRLVACGTAALRDAANAEDFLAGARALGVEIRVISGEEEARLIFQAVSRALPLPEAPAVLMDVGGGSTELTWVEAGIPKAMVSIPWGVQRLRDAFPLTESGEPGERARIRRQVKALAKEALQGRDPGFAPTLALGTSGTILELCRLAGDGQSFTRPALGPLGRTLWRFPAEERVGQLKVDPKRAEALPFGVLWVEALLQCLKVELVLGLPVGLREGLIWEALQRGGGDGRDLGARRSGSVRVLADRFDPDPGHSRHVGRLADSLFLQLQPHFELGHPERELLAHAAALHDIGHALSEKGHHRLGAYLVQNADLAGFWPKERTLIAQIVRHHRGKAPRRAEDEMFLSLAPWYQAVVEKLSALLRVADALDRTRRQAVRQVRIEVSDRRVDLVLQGSGDLHPEMEAARGKGRLLADLLGRRLRITSA